MDSEAAIPQHSFANSQQLHSSGHKVPLPYPFCVNFPANISLKFPYQVKKAWLIHSFMYWLIQEVCRKYLPKTRYFYNPQAFSHLHHAICMCFLFQVPPIQWLLCFLDTDTKFLMHIVPWVVYLHWKSTNTEAVIPWAYLLGSFSKEAYHQKELTFKNAGVSGASDSMWGVLLICQRLTRQPRIFNISLCTGHFKEIPILCSLHTAVICIFFWITG